MTFVTPVMEHWLEREIGPDPCGSDHYPIILENNGPSSLERLQRWKLAKANYVAYI